MNDTAHDVDAIGSPQEAQAAVDSLTNLIMEYTEFFSTLSHELRTPLTTIKGFGQALVAHWDDLSDDRKIAHVGHMLRSAARLERLVADISLSALLVDGVALDLAALDPNDVVAQAVVEGRALHPNREFLIAPSPVGRQIWADRVRLLQVLVNLLDNAAKYSPAEEPITARWREEDSRLRMEICDAGMSLSRTERESLFVRRGRLPAASRAGSMQSGSGLGLYICKGLVEAMGGAIGIESGDNGSGNTFWFTLPYSAD